MRSRTRLRRWLAQLLPAVGPCAHQAGAVLLRSLLVGFTTDLTQLARQAERPTAVRISRQFFARWLARPHFAPEAVYAALNRQCRRRLGKQGEVPLLVDFTDLQREWSVLQVSFPWQQRALPLYRAVMPYREPPAGRRPLLRMALAFLAKHLPGPRERYVLVADRGFPGHWLIRELRASGWRFVFRVTNRWKLAHPEYTGTLLAALAVPGLVGPAPRWLGEALLGRRGKGADEWSEAHVVLYQGCGFPEPLFLVTGEPEAARAVALYRERAKIECEFRDLKGPFGLDELADWQDQARVACFLALLALYEWRLAELWERHHLAQWGPRLVKYGRLSWIRTTREWIQHQIRLTARPALACL
jgi:hypothetical protein